MENVGVKGLADEGLQVIGAGVGLLDAVRQGGVALREQQVAETKPRRPSRRNAEPLVNARPRAAL